MAFGCGQFPWFKTVCRFLSQVLGTLWLRSEESEHSIQYPMSNDRPQSFNAGGPCVKWPDLSSTTAPEWCESGPQNLQTQMKSNLNWQELTWIFNYDNINRMIIQVTSIIQVNSMRKLTSIEWFCLSAMHDFGSLSAGSHSVPPVLRGPGFRCSNGRE